MTNWLTDIRFRFPAFHIVVKLFNNLVDKELAETKAKDQRLQVELAAMRAANNEHTGTAYTLNSEHPR